MKNRNNNKGLRRKSELATLELARHARIYPPPPFMTPFRGSTSLRYQATGASPANVTTMCLTRLMCFTVSTTQSESLLESIRLKRLHVWIQPYVAVGTTGSAVLDAPSPICTVEINSSAVDNLGPRKNVHMVAGSEGAYYCHKFKGAMADWISLVNVAVNATNLFTFAYVDCFPIVQLDFSYQFIIARSPSAAAALTTGSVVDTTSANAIVFLPLDNYASSGTEGTQVLPPMNGLSQITVNDPAPVLSRGVVSSSSSSIPTPSGVCHCIGCEPKVRSGHSTGREPGSSLQ